MIKPNKDEKTIECPECKDVLRIPFISGKGWRYCKKCKGSGYINAKQRR